VTVEDVTTTEFMGGRISSRLESGRTVTNAVGAARSFLARLWNRFQETGHVRRRPGQGRPCATTANNGRYKECFFSSDEAHFWFNGYVNKQNCRIWSEANPQVYVETPLHPEKLTVWCALCAGGILLQKR
ncbi:hypothetical protein TNCV_4178641, partial [Trichonephila clavipes]